MREQTNTLDATLPTNAIAASCFQVKTRVMDESRLSGWGRHAEEPKHKNKMRIKLEGSPSDPRVEVQERKRR